MKIRDLGFDLDAKRLMSKIARFCKIKERSLSSLHRLIGSIQLSFEIQAKTYIHVSFEKQLCSSM